MKIKITSLNVALICYVSKYDKANFLFPGNKEDSSAVQLGPGPADRGLRQLHRQDLRNSQRGRAPVLIRKSHNIMILNKTTK